MNNSAFLCFDLFLDHTKPTQSEVEQNSPSLTRTILPGSRLKAFHLLIIVHDPIKRRNLGRRHSVNFFVNKSQSPCTASKAPVARKCS